MIAAPVLLCVSGRSRCSESANRERKDLFQASRDWKPRAGAQSLGVASRPITTNTMEATMGFSSRRKRSAWQARATKNLKVHLIVELLESRLAPAVSFLGVAAGDATSSDAILWTRTQDSAAVPNPTTGYVPGISVGVDALVSTDPALASGVFYSGTTDPNHDY